jgi:hypothetical protein
MLKSRRIRHRNIAVDEGRYLTLAWAYLRVIYSF